MADNEYSLITDRLRTELLAGLAALYAGLVVERRVFKANALPTFDRYAIIISPNGVPWEERVVSVRTTQFIYKADLYLLVKAFNEELSLFGTSAPDRGIFEFLKDTKALVRGTNLSGLLDKTYEEPATPSQFEWSAANAFESGEKTFIHRIRQVVTVRTTPTCHPRI
jgi:hypothetical protein